MKKKHTKTMINDSATVTDVDYDDDAVDNSDFNRFS